MSAVFEMLFRGIEQLEGDRDIINEIRLLLDALHDVSHEHEDWLNRSQKARIAAGRLEKAIEKSTPCRRSLPCPDEQIGEP